MSVFDELLRSIWDVYLYTVRSGSRITQNDSGKRKNKVMSSKNGQSKKAMRNGSRLSGIICLEGSAIDSIAGAAATLGNTTVSFLDDIFKSIWMDGTDH